MTTLIALCGAPQSGKSTVQDFLLHQYGVLPLDDGEPMRDFATRHLGMTHWHVYSQPGKASYTTLPGGKLMQVRDTLGQLGNKIEELFGPDAIPAMALNRALAHPDKTRAYVFGSVRRKQAAFYKARGAKIVEIVRPGFEVVNEFDDYDRSMVDLTIHNDSTIAALQQRVAFHLGPILARETVP